MLEQVIQTFVEYIGPGVAAIIGIFLLYKHIRTDEALDRREKRISDRMESEINRLREEVQEARTGYEEERRLRQKLEIEVHELQLKVIKLEAMLRSEGIDLEI